MAVAGDMMDVTPWASTTPVPAQLTAMLSGLFPLVAALPSVIEGERDAAHHDFLFSVAKPAALSKRGMELIRHGLGLFFFFKPLAVA